MLVVVQLLIVGVKLLVLGHQGDIATSREKHDENMNRPDNAQTNQRKRIALEIFPSQCSEVRRRKQIDAGNKFRDLQREHGQMCKSTVQK